MHKDHYEVERDLTIYALIAEDLYVYVGKTKSRNLYAIVSRHSWGRCAATCWYFESCGSKRPKMYLLEKLRATEAVGYKHLLAYVSVFADEGFVVINHQRTLEQATNPHPDTALLADAIRATPLDILLERAYLPKPTTGYVPKKSALAPARKVVADERLCVRMSEEERERFDELRAELGLSQRDTITYLVNTQSAQRLGSEEWRVDRLVERTIKGYQNQIALLQKENKKLYHKLNRRGPDAPSSFQTAKIEFIKHGVESYFQHFASSVAYRAIAKGDYRRFTRMLPKEDRYAYPTEEGYMVFYPEMFLWGKAKTPVGFVLGIGADNKKYKLRYYDKYYYVGPRINGERFGYSNTCWYIGYKEAADGAMDIVLSLPLSVFPIEEDREPAEEEKKPALDDYIAKVQENSF